MRSHGTQVFDTPKQFNRTSHHAILAPGDNSLTLPLEMKGVISYLHTRKPTPQVLTDCDFIELTSGSLWDPYNDHFAEQEAHID
jgi:hypothetical protein